MKRLLLAGALALLPLAGHADPIYVTGFSLPHNEIVTINYDDGTNPVVHEQVYAGQIEFQLPAGHSELVWCDDIFADLHTGTFSIADKPSFDPSLFDTISALVLHGNTALTKGGDLGGYSAAQVSAATQVAIWQVEYGDAFSFTASDGALSGLVSQYISNAQDGTFKPTNHLLELASNGNQSQLAVPEPLTLAVFGSGLFGLGLIRRRYAS